MSITIFFAQPKQRIGITHKTLPRVATDSMVPTLTASDHVIEERKIILSELSSASLNSDASEII